ncbi:hypothetical protein H311_04062, partial [Anncaliia algerae PRA109]
MIKVTTDDITLLNTNKTQIPLRDILLLGTEVLCLILHNNKECLGCFSLSNFCGNNYCSNFDKDVKFNEILMNKYQINIFKKEEKIEEIAIQVPKVEEVKEVKKEIKRTRINGINKSNDKWNKQEKMIKELTKEIYYLNRRNRRR